MTDLSAPDASAAELVAADAFGKAMQRYWRDFPWEAGAAQWGCEIFDLILEYNEATPEWKVGFPSVQFGASCDDPSFMLTVHQITSLNTAALERFPAEGPESEAAEPSAAGEIGPLAERCGVVIGGGSHCLNVAAGVQSGSYKWLGTTMHGRLRLGTASVVYPSCNAASTLKTGPVYTYSTNTLRSIGSTYAMSANWFLAFDQATSSGSVTGERSRICVAG
ncbi:hypothetical protein [Agromyces soli]|uniref:Uncharacterized protein n=1 Tax=Agromyces soli TaxID=659012 RepID=A0ABY4AXF9_9MICO|nr:hypothetical protein [Agromyces soli]UOE27834.1 hypothetical protein MTP13_08680 [Agromyces soli]